MKIDAYYRSTHIEIDYKIFPNQQPRCISYKTDGFMLQKLYNHKDLVKKITYTAANYKQKETFVYNKDGLPIQKKFYYKSSENTRRYIIKYQYE